MTTSPVRSMLDLSSITLICVDTRAPDLATWAINRCLRHARFGAVVLMTNLDRVGTRQEGIAYVQAPPIRNVHDYSQVMLTGIGQHVVGSHALVIQWDGFILRPDLWDEAFLRYDYIGAVWPQFPKTPVGNGGFSLRSRRLLDAMRDPEIVIRHPEDKCIAITNRRCLETKYGIRFAPMEIAERFSVERTPWHPAFGFHGFFNFAEVFSADELAALMPEIPDACCRSIDTYDLIDALLDRGATSTAAALLAKSRPRLKLWMRHRAARRAIDARRNGP